MHSDSSDDELLSLRQKVETLSTMLGTIHQESNQTIDKLEMRLKDQQAFNANIVKLLEEKGLASHLSSTDDTDNIFTQLVHGADNIGDIKSDAERSHPKSNTTSSSDSGSSDRCIKTNSFTQTNLAIDPETSVKLSFISAGISSYGSSIENSSSKHTITSTPASSNQYQAHSDTQSYRHVYQTSTDRISPTSLNKDFSDRNSQAQDVPVREHEDKYAAGDKQQGGAGRPPPFPTTVNTPSKQSPTQTQGQTSTQTGSAPLKSILRTPTHEKTPSQGGPLSSFSPSLSPIQSLLTSTLGGGHRNDHETTSPSIFDDSHIEHDDKDEDDSHMAEGTNRANTVNLSASLFMSPLHYDSSDADGSLQSLSLLNVTSNTTLASGVGASSPGQRRRDHISLSNPGDYSYSSRVPRKKKSPATRRRTSSDNVSEDPKYFRDGDFEFPSGTSGEALSGGAVHGDNGAYHTPTKDSTHSSMSSNANRSAHTTGYNKRRVNANGFVKLQHFSESKRTSGFWKERLGKRDLTSVLGSPLSQKLF